MAIAPTQAFDWKWFLLSFQGRIPRSWFWLRYFVPIVVIGFVLGFVEVMFGLQGQESGIGYLSLIFNLAIIWPSLAVGIKRCHDRNKSGWWILISFIPLIGLIWYIVDLGCLKGTEGPNRFGDDPLAGTGAPLSVTPPATS